MNLTDGTILCGRRYFDGLVPHLLYLFVVFTIAHELCFLNQNSV